MKLMVVLFCHSLYLSSGTVEYSNRWTVQIDGDMVEADKLARKHGFVNQGKIIENYYSFEHHKAEKISDHGSAHLHKGLLSEQNVKMVEQQELKSYDLLSSQSVDFHTNDPRFNDMWYIIRADQPSYNVIDVWKRNITGEGVVVAVVDDGLEPEHPEIQGNYDQAASFDVVDNDTYPSSNDQEYVHGTKCAGIIAAAFDNSNCGVGLAYRARVGGIRLFYKMRSTDADEARALSYAADHIDIYSNSWGPSDRGFRVVGPGYFTQNVLRIGAEKGRRGLGSIYVFAAGNGGLFAKDSCTFNGYVNSIYTIAISGIKSDGSRPVFGENCPGIMAVTYTRDVMRDQSKVITSGASKSCVDDFNASSAAGAMASGLIALMLSANRKLSWRDIQHIIVRTARPDPIRFSGEEWGTNKAGLRVNDYVGFGLMDAKRMVDTAVNWTTVPPKVNCTIPRIGINSRIPSREALEETIDLTNWRDFCGDKINYLEHVEVSVNLNYTRRGDLLIKLISPQQTVSNLTFYRMADSQYGSTDLNWVLMTLHHWGESATGLWKLHLKNSQLHHVNTGILFNWTLILHGTIEDPLDYRPRPPTSVRPQSRKPQQDSTTPKSTSLVYSTHAGVTRVTGIPSGHTELSTEAFSRKSFFPRTSETSVEPDLPTTPYMRRLTGGEAGAMAGGGLLIAIVVGGVVGFKAGVIFGVAVGGVIPIGIAVAVGVGVLAGIAVGIAAGLAVAAFGVSVVVVVILYLKRRSLKRSGSLHPLQEKRKQTGITFAEINVAAEV